MQYLSISKDPVPHALKYDRAYTNHGGLMLSNMALQMGIDAGVIALGLFCFFWILLGLGGAMLAISMNWPFKFRSHRAQEKDPALGEGHHPPPATP